MLSMELQLGLALPVHSHITKGFDLNHRRFDPDLEVAAGSLRSKSKRGFEEAFGKIGDQDHELVVPDFLVWDGQPNEEDDRKGHKKRYSHPINKSESDEESYIVGWPPIKSSRKKELIHQHKGGRVLNHQKRASIVANNKIMVINGQNSSSATTLSNNNNNHSTSMYVKVKMEGVAIARKVDLTLHHSYPSLKNALVTMFTHYDGKCNEDVESYTLTYQDKEGDWLLAGDVPWKSFIESVQRLEIVRNGG